MKKYNFFLEIFLFYLWAVFFCGRIFFLPKKNYLWTKCFIPFCPEVIDFYLPYCEHEFQKILIFCDFFSEGNFFLWAKNGILSKKKEIWKKLFRRKSIIFFWKFFCFFCGRFFLWANFFCGRFFFVGETFFVGKVTPDLHLVAPGLQVNMM